MGGGRGRDDNSRLHTQRNKRKLELGGVLGVGGLGGSAPVSSPSLSSSLLLFWIPAMLPACKNPTEKQEADLTERERDSVETLSGRWPRREFAIPPVPGCFPSSFVIISVGGSKSCGGGRKGTSSTWRSDAHAFASDVTLIDADWSGRRLSRSLLPRKCFLSRALPSRRRPSHLLPPPTQFSRKLTRRRRHKIEIRN